MFDLINCGPKNRFTIVTDNGPLIVHNCENVVQAICRDLLGVAERVDARVRRGARRLEVDPHETDVPIPFPITTIRYLERYNFRSFHIPVILSQCMRYRPIVALAYL